MTLTQEEAFARIRLLRSPNVGPVSYAQLLRRFGDAQRAIEALPNLASRGGRAYRPAPSEAIEREVTEARRAGARYLFHDSPDYPALLGQIEDAPPILIVRAVPRWTTTTPLAVCTIAPMPPSEAIPAASAASRPCRRCIRRSRRSARRAHGP